MADKPLTQRIRETPGFDPNLWLNDASSFLRDAQVRSNYNAIAALRAVLADRFSSQIGYDNERSYREADAFLFTAATKADELSHGDPVRDFYSRATGYKNSELAGATR